MITGWTLFIVFVVAFGNAWVALIGVPFRIRKGMRVRASDDGRYLPPHFAFAGFYRGLCINLNFAGSSFALTAVCLVGDSKSYGREAIVGIGLLNFLCSIVVGCLVPADFEKVLVPFRGAFWRVAVVGGAALALFLVSGFVIGDYV